MCKPSWLSSAPIIVIGKTKILLFLSQFLTVWDKIYAFVMHLPVKWNRFWQRIGWNGWDYLESQLLFYMSYDFLIPCISRYPPFFGRFTYISISSIKMLHFFLCKHWVHWTIKSHFLIWNCYTSSSVLSRDELLREESEWISKEVIE